MYNIITCFLEKSTGKYISLKSHMLQMNRSTLHTFGELI